MKYPLLLAATALCSTAVSAEILSVHCPTGCPQNPAANDMIFNHLYAMSNNPKTKFADWVAYEVDVVNFGASPGRDWATDPLLDENETLEAKDYTGARNSELEADRGHQAPLASFAGSRYWSELNYLSNITPQDKHLNQGPWKALEDAVRSGVSYGKSLYVITGPLYEQSMPALPKADETHQVPSGYFKLVYNMKGEAAGFIMQQSAGRKDDFCASAVSFAKIQSDTQYELPVLKDSSVIAKRLGC
ncbi:DNA/RNA non-specific endonuclease [Aliamphritea ceti]|uniref:DNA/RNA non-specific endonuclease n=1 Tax=Aliamphritea ceti TaxID=1524258 RepID=UPI0021C2588B|nr:DNA/RNA non-specific endonuclease [Aliamphritea ceti]